MARAPLSNYLRTHRRRVGLSQEEVAFLLGAGSGTRVCRHEGRQRMPNLPAALGYAVLFDVPMRELFAGEVHKVETIIRKRLPELVARVQRNGRRGTLPRATFLEALARRLAKSS